VYYINLLWETKPCAKDTMNFTQSTSPPVEDHCMSSPNEIPDNGDENPMEFGLTHRRELEKMVEEQQKLWADAIVNISALYSNKGDYVSATSNAVSRLYGFANFKVIFKPTSATENPFRPTFEDAMSYFVGSEVMSNNKFKDEDEGFAINRGRGWSDVKFRNHTIHTQSDCPNYVLTMGEHIFTDATDGTQSRFECSFGYKRCEASQRWFICLHHSSVPYTNVVSGISFLKHKIRTLEDKNAKLEEIVKGLPDIDRLKAEVDMLMDHFVKINMVDDEEPEDDNELDDKELDDKESNYKWPGEEESWREEKLKDAEVVGVRRYKDCGLSLLMKDNDNTVLRTLESFIREDYFTNQHVCDLVNEWNEKAKNDKWAHRLCLLCKNKAVVGKTLCPECIHNDMEDIIYG